MFRGFMPSFSRYLLAARSVLAKADNVVVISESTVEFSNDSAFVYVVKAEKPEQVFDKKHIEISLSDGINIEVKKGLTLDDKIRGNVIDTKTKKEIKQ